MKTISGIRLKFASRKTKRRSLATVRIVSQFEIAARFSYPFHGSLVSAGSAYPALVLSNGSAARAFKCHCSSTVISAGDYPPDDATDEEKSRSKCYVHRDSVHKAFCRG